MPTEISVPAPADTHSDPLLLSVLTEITQTQAIHSALLQDVLTALTEEPEDASDFAVALQTLGTNVAYQTAAIKNLGNGIDELVRLMSDHTGGASTDTARPAVS